MTWIWTDPMRTLRSKNARLVKKVGEEEIPLGQKETPLGEKVTKLAKKVNFVGEKKIVQTAAAGPAT